VRAVSVGYYHTCAVTAGGLRCFGFNDHGALGDGSTDKRRGPVAVKLAAVQVSASKGAMSNHTCALDAAGVVRCWGSNQSGQSAADSKEMKLVLPTPVKGVPVSSRVVAGDEASCALGKNGKLTCWGANPRGTLGLPTGGHLAPRVVAGIDDVQGFDLGSDGACALRKNGSVWCWGRVTGSEQPAGPAAVPGLPKAKALAVGGYLAAALGEDGSLWTWWLAERKPTKVDGAPAAVELTCGGSHCCARDAQSVAWCWGDNTSGELGDPRVGVGGERKTAGKVGL
jgi:alpha-tubulin suppressor-like RCC1 family protein